MKQKEADPKQEFFAMNKKSIDKKAAQLFITESRNNGKSNQEIYDELAKLYYNKKSIALLILGTVKSELKSRYKLEPGNPIIFYLGYFRFWY